MRALMLGAVLLFGAGAAGPVAPAKTGAESMIDTMRKAVSMLQSGPVDAYDAARALARKVEEGQTDLSIRFVPLDDGFKQGRVARLGTPPQTSVIGFQIARPGSITLAALERAFGKPREVPVPHPMAAEQREFKASKNVRLIATLDKDAVYPVEISIVR